MGNFSILDTFSEEASIVQHDNSISLMKKILIQTLIQLSRNVEIVKYWYFSLTPSYETINTNILEFYCRIIFVNLKSFFSSLKTG